MIPLSDNIRSRGAPYVTIAIICSCVMVFVYELLNPEFINTWAFRPDYLLPGQMLTVGLPFVAQSMLISVFLHGGFLHIGGNVLFLWVFGDNVEDRMGHGKFLLFYLLCGAVATLAHSLSAALGLMHDPAALSHGVVGAYLVLFPGSSVRTLVVLFIFVTVINLPAALFIVLWFILQLFSGLGSLASAGTGIAHWAHIGGFVVGFAIARRMRSQSRRQPPAPRIVNIDVDDL